MLSLDSVFCFLHQLITLLLTKGQPFHCILLKMDYDSFEVFDAFFVFVSEAEVSRDELFGQFYTALDNINFFTTIPGGDEDHAQLAKATTFFENAVLVCFLVHPV